MSTRSTEDGSFHFDHREVLELCCEGQKPIDTVFVFFKRFNKGFFGLKLASSY